MRSERRFDPRENARRRWAKAAFAPCPRVTAARFSTLQCASARQAVHGILHAGPHNDAAEDGA